MPDIDPAFPVVGNSECLHGQRAGCPAIFDDILQREIAETFNVVRHLGRELAESVGPRVSGATHDSSAVALRACWKGQKVKRVKEQAVLFLEPRANLSLCERI